MRQIYPFSLDTGDKRFKFDVISLYNKLVQDRVVGWSCIVLTVLNYDEIKFDIYVEHGGYNRSSDLEETFEITSSDIWTDIKPFVGRHVSDIAEDEHAAAELAEIKRQIGIRKRAIWADMMTERRRQMRRAK